MKFEEINDKTREGQLLTMAIGRLTARYEPNKTPDQVVTELDKMAETIYRYGGTPDEPLGARGVFIPLDEQDFFDFQRLFVHGKDWKDVAREIIARDNKREADAILKATREYKGPKYLK